MQTATKFTPVKVSERKKLDMRAGDTVRVYVKIREKDKTRLQVFEGLVLARKHGTEPGATFTVRKVKGSVGVERIFPLYSPVIDKIEVVRRSKTRRSKLYYIREKVAREVRRKMRNERMAAAEMKDDDEIMDVSEREAADDARAEEEAVIEEAKAEEKEVKE